MSEPGDRRPEGSERVDSVLRDVLGSAPIRRGVALGRLVRRWPGVVGEPLGSQTAPVALDRGVLVVAAASGAWAAQVRFLAEEIRRRINEELRTHEVEEVHAVRVTVRPPSDPERS